LHRQIQLSGAIFGQQDPRILVIIVILPFAKEEEQ
jgi:hypothetical protein